MKEEPEIVLVTSKKEDDGFEMTCRRCGGSMTKMIEAKKYFFSECPKCKAEGSEGGRMILKGGATVSGGNGVIKFEC